MPVTSAIDDDALDRKSFDYIIVGAGAAGCALAAGLTDDASCNVLLIEAGKYFGRVDQYPDLLQRIDKYTFSLAPGETYPADPPYETFTWSYEGRLNEFLRARIVRGRVVGGSSAINGSSFTRGRPQDYDRWAELGNTEWSFEKVLPALRAIETDLDFGDTQAHGARGAIRVKRPEEANLGLMSRLFIDASLDAGFRWDPDINGFNTGGVGLSPLNAVNALRQNAGAAFLDRVIERANLSLLDQTPVQRILLEKSTAVGVKVLREGVLKQLRASEVILCAGGLNSPHLMMLSGLGPADHLRKVGVVPVHDLPHVGQNLADHPYVILPVTAPTKELGKDVKTGGGLILNYSSSRDDNEDSRIIPYATPRGAQASAEVATWGFHCSLGTPLSRGEIILRSGSARQQPMIEYNYLREPEDRRRMRECVRLAMSFVERPDYKNVGAAQTELTAAKARDDATIDEWIATHLWTAYHSAGTCKMGPDSDETAVVDQYGRVRGVDRLRVADISILPTLMTRGTHATAVMIGEHMASLLRRKASFA